MYVSTIGTVDTYFKITIKKNFYLIVKDKKKQSKKKNYKTVIQKKTLKLAHCLPQNDMKTANTTAPGLSKVAADVHLYNPQVSSTLVKPQKLTLHLLVGHKIQSATCDFGLQISWLNELIK